MIPAALSTVVWKDPGLSVTGSDYVFRQATVAPLLCLAYPAHLLHGAVTSTSRDTDTSSILDKKICLCLYLNKPSQFESTTSPSPDSDFDTWTSTGATMLDCEAFKR